MSDLYKRTEVNWGGAMASDRGLLVPNKGFTGFLMQQLTLAYTQNVTRVYEIGNKGLPTSIYYIGGRSNGTLNAAHIIGPRLTMLQFYQNFSDVCAAETNDIKIDLNARCDHPGDFGNEISYNCKYCVLVNVGLSVGAQEIVINENSMLMFSNMEYTEVGSAVIGGSEFATAAATAAAAAAARGNRLVGAGAGIGGFDFMPPADDNISALGGTIMSRVP